MYKHIKVTFLNIFTVVILFVGCKTLRNVQDAQSLTKSSNFRLSSIKLKDLSGHLVDLKEFEGKPIFINFWATWCSPCRSELSSIMKLSERYQNEIIFLEASHEEVETILHFKQDHKTNLKFLILENEYLDLYITKLPTTFLINRKGKIFEEIEGFRDWTETDQEDMIIELLENDK
ncbi:MAG: TlpA disulfide reductase family protein [Saprospiraceae bacterium]